MTHTFEFVVKIAHEKYPIIHMCYKGKSSRHAKVKQKIYQDLIKVYGIDPLQVSELYLKPIKNQSK